MRRLVFIGCLLCLTLLGGMLLYLARGTERDRSKADDPRGTAVPDDVAGLSEATPPPPKLPETAPPAGMPIDAWEPRDSFPVIRKPWYVSAQQGDGLLAADEPVLGLVLDGQARAYSTNQLNEHEMVLDEIAGTPVLVTY